MSANSKKSSFKNSIRKRNNNISLNKQFSKDNDSLNKSYKSYTPNKINNINFKRKIKFLSQTINNDNIDYINRPIINFKPKMELYECKHEKIINPSKLKYVVPITQPSCHKFKKIVSLKKNNNNKNKFLYSFSPNYEFENFMKEMNFIKMKNFISLKKLKK